MKIDEKKIYEILCTDEQQKGLLVSSFFWGDLERSLQLAFDEVMAKRNGIF